MLIRACQKKKTETGFIFPLEAQLGVAEQLQHCCIETLVQKDLGWS